LTLTFESRSILVFQGDIKCARDIVDSPRSKRYEGEFISLRQGVAVYATVEHSLIKSLLANVNSR